MWWSQVYRKFTSNYDTPSCFVFGKSLYWWGIRSRLRCSFLVSLFCLYDNDGILSRISAILHGHFQTFELSAVLVGVPKYVYSSRLSFVTPRACICGPTGMHLESREITYGGPQNHSWFLSSYDHLSDMNNYKISISKLLSHSKISNS